MASLLNIKHLLLDAKQGDLPPAGVFLCSAILAIPALQVFLYPDMTTGGGYVLYNILITLVEFIFCLLIILKRRTYGYNLNHLPLLLAGAFMLWFLAVVLSIPDMPLQAGGLIVTIRFAIHFCFFIALGSFLVQHPSAAQRLLLSLLISGIIMLPLFWARLYLTYDQPDFDWTWSLPGFTNVRHLDYFLGALVSLLGLLPLTRLFQDSTRTLHVTLTLLLALCWGMIFWSGGRGSAVAAFLSVTTLLLFFRPGGWRKIALYNLSILFIAAVISAFLPAPNGSYGILRFMTKITETDSLDAFSAGRLAIWQQVYAVWLENFWFGIGAGQTKTIIPAASATFGQPHNIILQALMSWGVIGGGAFLITLFAGFWTRLRQFQCLPEHRNSIHIVAYGLALTLAVNALVDGTLYYPLPIFLFIIGFACAIAPKASST
tara:strand:- start:545 stop:1840 length:1296 start_codon:yes stop_codon:yes gene_type:complete